MARFMAKVLAALMLVQLSLAANYCSPFWCTDFKGKVTPHIACKHPGLDPKCLNAETLELTQEQKDLFLSTHNDFRNKIALGNEPGYGKCDRMATMVWDDTLAYFASLNTQACTLGYDQCHNTENFRYSGQNVAYEGSKPDTPDVEETIIGAVTGWYSENLYANSSDILKFSRSKNVALNREIGHFTQTVNAKSIAVGCGMTTYEDKDGWEKTLTTCNYATSNLIGYSVYTVGETAARCKTGTNPDYPGLCSVAEAIDVNSYWLATVARIAKENNSKNRK